ncbi:MAG TPA: alpha-glucan family phosphorylase, partial [Saprospiraceae bacterium]|nr:alpha-glucan family phosphorylase [Saprospiraceae bacterium]
DVRRLTGMYNDMFEYTPAALRLSGIANGVSQLHGEVARKMWKDYPNTCKIIAITNAQDEVYWTDSKLRLALDTNDDEALVNRKLELKKRLFKTVANQAGDLFDPKVLTIVWARRFAGYKRPDLILRDFERFQKLINNHKHPVQIIWAGKPFPEDQNGVNQFNYIIGQTYKAPRMSILTGYELELSAILKMGADIWLNTPRRPQEASGTSGMTAAMNGAINLSINDGWIPEFARHGRNSFIVPEANEFAPHHEQDHHDHHHIFELLEHEIVPMYYEHKEQWLEIMKNSMREVVPQFDSKRMADEYYRLMYTNDSILR